MDLGRYQLRDYWDRGKYERYLRSAWWRRRRAEHLRVQPTCTDCGTTKRLQVHHRNYFRLGRELETDLRTVCAACHKRRHGLTQTQARGDMRTTLLAKDYWGRTASGSDGGR